jgi:hypothetical protein
MMKNNNNKEIDLCIVEIFSILCTNFFFLEIFQDCHV